MGRTIAELAQEYSAAAEVRDAATKEVERAEARLKQAREALIAALDEQGVDRCTAGGYSYTSASKPHYSVRSGMSDDLLSALRANGYGDIIREAVHPQTLKAFCAEQMDAGGGQLPAWMEPMINSYFEPVIRRRKL